MRYNGQYKISIRFSNSKLFIHVTDAGSVLTVEIVRDKQIFAKAFEIVNNAIDVVNHN